MTNLKEFLETDYLEGDSEHEELSNIVADIASEKRYEDVLRKLFAESSGKWLIFSSLCQAHSAILERLEELENEYQDKIRVTWLEYPESVYGLGYVTIIFFFEALNWKSLILYNKNILSI
jgi:hypothetical protein